MLKLKAHIVSRGSAKGDALVTSQPISFLGSIDPMTGIVVEKGHELRERALKRKFWCSLPAKAQQWGHT